MDITKKININLILIILLISCIIYFTFTNNEGYSNIDIEKINFDFNNERINKLLNYVATTYFNNKVTISELNDPNSINIDNLKNLNEANIITETQVIKNNLLNLSFSDIKYLLAYANIYRSVFNYFYISNNDNYNKNKLKMYLNIIDVGISELNKELIAKQNIVDSNMPSYSDNNIKKTFGSLACQIGKTYLPSNLSSSNGICCPPNNQNINNGCCPTARVNSEKMICCPEGKIDIGGICCRPDNKNIKGQCCSPDKNIGNDICCKSNEIIATDSNDANNKICCPEGQYNIDGICCDNPNKVNINGRCQYPLEGYSNINQYKNNNNSLEGYSNINECNGDKAYFNISLAPTNSFKLKNLNDKNGNNNCEKSCNDSGNQCNGYLVYEDSNNNYNCNLYTIPENNNIKIHKSCNPSTGLNKSYYFEEKSMSWNEHNSNAIKMGYDSLVCFENYDEFNNLFEILPEIKNKYFWIGAERKKNKPPPPPGRDGGPKTQDYWGWVDKSDWGDWISNTPNIWSPGEPNNCPCGRKNLPIYEDKIQVYSNRRWNDLTKTAKIAGVYQRRNIEFTSFGKIRSNIQYTLINQ